MCLFPASGTAGRTEVQVLYAKGIMVRTYMGPSNVLRGHVSYVEIYRFAPASRAGSEIREVFSRQVTVGQMKSHKEGMVIATSQVEAVSHRVPGC